MDLVKNSSRQTKGSGPVKTNDLACKQSRHTQHHREKKGRVTSTSAEEEVFTDCNAAAVSPCGIPGGCSRHRRWWAFKEQRMTEVKKAHSCGDTTYGRLPKHQCCTSCSNLEHKKEATNTHACNRRDWNEQDSTDQQIQGHARSTKGIQGGRPKRIPTVTEVHSRPRVTAYSETHVPGHIKAGPAYDL